MKINVRFERPENLIQPRRKKQLFIDAEMIMRYLLDDDEIDTLITCKNTEYDFVTYDQSLYEAVGSVEREKININKLVKFLEVVTVVSYEFRFNRPKSVLTDKRIMELRDKVKNAMSRQSEKETK